MRLQLLSDLHLETESYDPEPAPDAELLVLAGDIDAGWDALARFRGWPQPVVFVAGNHEYDGRDVDASTAALRDVCASHGITMLERDRLVVSDADGARIRIVGTTRWSDFDLFGVVGRAKAMRAGSYFMDLMQATQAEPANRLTHVVGAADKADHPFDFYRAFGGVLLVCRHRASPAACSVFFSRPVISSTVLVRVSAT